MSGACFTCWRERRTRWKAWRPSSKSARRIGRAARPGEAEAIAALTKGESQRFVKRELRHALHEPLDPKCRPGAPVARSRRRYQRARRAGLAGPDRIGRPRLRPEPWL